MPSTKTEKNKKIAFVMLAIMAAASVLSFGTKVFAQDATPVVQEASGLDKVIKGT